MTCTRCVARVTVCRRRPSCWTATQFSQDSIQRRRADFAVLKFSTLSKAPTAISCSAPAKGCRAPFSVWRSRNPPAAGAPEGTASSLDVRVFARGLLRHLMTRVYFSDGSNDGDPVLRAVAPDRRATLIASREDGPSGPPTYRFDVRLQGPGETVFFELVDDSR